MATAKKSENKPLPNSGIEIKEKPTPTRERKPVPKIGKPENAIKIGDTMLEIQPTKLKYHRNRTAAFYRYVEVYPLPEILAMKAGAFGDDRDGDKALMDWLIAATDNEQLIVDNYDELDTETVERILAIFKRVNMIDEKEERLKNLRTPAAGE